MAGNGAAAEARAALMMRLRRNGIRSLKVLRAMEAVPRSLFMPRHLADHAARDIALPIACGQTSHRPSFVARGLEALDCSGGEAVLEIGSGSGFVTALLAKIAAKVDGVERFRRLAEDAGTRLRDLGVPAATVTWGDGLAFDETSPRYDRILLHVAMTALPGAMLDRLAPGGLIVYPRGSGPEQMLTRAVVMPEGNLSETVICPSEVSAPLAGRSASL